MNGQLFWATYIRLIEVAPCSEVTFHNSTGDKKKLYNFLTVQHSSALEIGTLCSMGVPLL